MDAFDNILGRATAAIEDHYILLPVAGGPAKHLERVYCYELYHQMRIKWPRRTPYVLNGEIHKGGHPIISQLDTRFAMPDFLIHRPGSMDSNYAIIEVKKPKAGIEAVERDLVKLNEFRSVVGYSRSIYLVYGVDGRSTSMLIERIDEIVKRIGLQGPIELWLHRQAGTAASNVHTFGSSSIF